IYNGGSQAGNIRLIHVLSIESDRVWARCINTGIRKQYLLSRIERPNSNYGGVYYDSDIYVKSRERKNTRTTKDSDSITITVDAMEIANSILDKHNSQINRESTRKSSGRTLDESMAMLKASQAELEKLRAKALRKGWIKDERAKSVAQVKNTIPAKHTKNNKPNFGCLFICVFFTLCVLYLVF
ncbi:MAG: hypothetical protein ACRCXK_01845, partial [Wohlfahrtiimonas sp.]